MGGGQMNFVIIISTHYDYLASNLVEGFQRLSAIGHIGTVEVYTGKTGEPSREAMDRADWIIRLSGVDVPAVDFSDYKVKVAVVDGADEAWRVLDHIPHRVYFKRENGPAAHGAVPLSFSAIENVYDRQIVPWDERDVDVFFAAHLPSHTIRTEIWNRLSALTNEYRIVMAGKDPWPRMGRDEYLETLSRSKIFVSAYGTGQDTNNYWEAPALGTVLLAQERTIQINNNFKDLEDGVFFLDAAGMETRLNFILKGSFEEKLKLIAMRGAVKARTFHTSSSRAREVIQHLKKVEDQ